LTLVAVTKIATINTARLALRELSFNDRQFILELLNEPTFKEFIGDKDVKNLDDAERYLRDGPIVSYRDHGYGLLHVALRNSGEPIGVCGLLQRPSLDDPDLGFALSRQHWSKGYAIEAAQAVLEWGFGVLKLKRIIALADADNGRSVRVLDNLGFRFDKNCRMPGEAEEVGLYVLESSARRHDRGSNPSE